jgi:hypothetical protein
MKLTTFACMATAMLLASCGGGGSNGSSPAPVITPGSGVTTQSVSGTLLIGNPGSTATSTNRSPAFVSASTKHVALFIDGAATTAGQTTTCSASTGTGTGCTITWAAQLTVPAAHTFAVEADTGSNGPANTVLSIGSGSYAIVAGSGNTLAALSLNGIATGVTYTVGTCSGVSPNSTCPGTLTIAAAAGNAIAYTGATTVPTTGNLPTSGNVFDNGPATFVSSAPAVGTITGTAQATFSTFTTGTLSVSGVDTTGAYTYAVTCGAGTTGSFGITAGGAATADTIITTAELATLAPAVVFPAAGLTLTGTAPAFTCTAGNITSTGGTLPVN